MKTLSVLLIYNLFSTPILGHAANIRHDADLADYSFKKACEELVSNTEAGTTTTIKPGFWFWQDRELKEEVSKYNSKLPPEVRLIRGSHASACQFSRYRN